ncbi:MAG: hypothetical protein PHI05_02540 [Bacilli bacterium]|nr:hypothetical protein [Bacilli bacterium]MDD4547602.1 hypothetical protein [Bacilli bacterium]
MKALNIDQKVIANLKKLNVKSLNIESDLYILAKKYLIKVFIDDDQDFLIEKEKKVSALSKKNVAGTIPVFSSINIDNKFGGYVMPYIENSIELGEIVNTNISKEQLIKVLIRISETLENMHKENIIYGDIGESNIIVDEKLNPYFVDMDGAIVDGIGRSNVPKLFFGNKFVKDDTPSKELDIYLLNILFINLLSKQNVSKMDFEELFKVIDNLDISDGLKQYFSLIPNGIQSNYVTDLLKKEISNKHVK